jgi:hypothetical protein
VLHQDIGVVGHLQTLNQGNRESFKNSSNGSP